MSFRPPESVMERAKALRRMMLDPNVGISIVRQGEPVDGPYGQIAGDPVIVASELPAAITPMTVQANERYFGLVQTDDQRWVIELPADTDVQSSDVLTTVDGRTYQILVVQPVVASMLVVGVLQ